MEVKAKAEAEQMAKKADAWSEYKEAALVDMMLQVVVVQGSSSSRHDAPGSSSTRKQL